MFVLVLDLLVSVLSVDLDSLSTVVLVNPDLLFSSHAVLWSTTALFLSDADVFTITIALPSRSLNCYAFVRLDLSGLCSLVVFVA